MEYNPKVLDLKVGDLCLSECGKPARYIGGFVCVHKGPVGIGRPLAQRFRFCAAVDLYEGPFDGPTVEEAQILEWGADFGAKDDALPKLFKGLLHPSQVIAIPVDRN